VGWRLAGKVAVLLAAASSCPRFLFFVIALKAKGPRSPLHPIPSLF